MAPGELKTALTEFFSSYVVYDNGQPIIRVSIDSITPTFSENLAKVNGAVVDVGIGASGAGTQRIAVSSDTVIHVINDASSAVIGHVIVDSGVITSVTAITNALPSGTNILGKVGIDQTTPGTTNLVQTKETPDATATFSITPYFSAALEASRIVKASPGNLFGFVFGNSNAALRYVQFFNSTTLPADGAVPALSFPVQGNSPFSFDTGKFANFFTVGMVICNSTTQFTKTIGAADSTFYVQYL